jgi:hypothetical protein
MHEKDRASRRGGVREYRDDEAYSLDKLRRRPMRKFPSSVNAPYFMYRRGAVIYYKLFLGGGTGIPCLLGLRDKLPYLHHGCCLLLG